MKLIIKALLIAMLAVGALSSSSKKLQNKMATEIESTSTVFEFLQNMELSQMKAHNNTTVGSSPAPANNNNQTTNTSNYVKNLNDPNVQLQNWLSVSSSAFMNPNKFPTLKAQSGDNIGLKFGTEMDRLNEKYAVSQAQGSLSEYNFWFKIRGGYMYYFATKEDINILGSILVKRAENSNTQNKHAKQNITDSCFDVYDMANDKYQICAMTTEVKLEWLCSLQSFVKMTNIDSRCGVQEKLATAQVDQVELKKITQPVIIIPLSSRKCNEKFNYLNKGKDWECTCAEGRSQSPIDLPLKEGTTLSSLRPMFQYATVNAIATQSSADGLVTAGEYIKIRYDKGSIRIRHTNMGKIVTNDGGVYIAEEIIFHTPSEHTINGERLDMEMQIIHYGKSKGDIAKQVVLSFLFKAKPGNYNKFLDKLDFFNLPNPTDTFRDITNDFFIPSIFRSIDDEDIQSMSPFSFYTYEGSLTAPPCTERTLHYVAADPIMLSNTVISLFKEALRIPDLMNDKGEYVISDDSEKENYREIQPLNGRSVFLFDHIKFNCPEFKKERKVQPQGHYEKRQVEVNQYIYVNGQDPSGIANSFVVPEDEAKGFDGSIPENNDSKHSKPN